MRRFELVEDKSSKFWEIDLSEAVFTVRFGRIGTNGQTQEKSFADASKARAEHDKLVAEKLKKGYSEVALGSAPAPVAPAPTATPTPAPTPTPAAPTPAPAPTLAPTPTPAPTPTQPARTTGSPPVASPAPAVAPPTAIAIADLADEDRIFWSNALVKKVYPRRGGVATRITAPRTGKFTWLSITWMVGAWLRPTVLTGSSREELARFAVSTRIQAGPPSASSVADDALMHSLLHYNERDHDIDADVWFDMLVATSSLAHAVAVAHSAVEMHLARDAAGPASWVPSWHHRIPPGLARVREQLVICDAKALAEARAQAHALRAQANSDMQRATLTFLFPDERAWFEEDVRLVRRGAHAFVLASAADAALLDKLVIDPLDFKLLKATLIDGCGPAIGPLLAAQPPGYGPSREHYEALAAVGHDAAMQALIVASEADDGHIALASLALAASSQPRRALRLIAPLAADRTKTAEGYRRILTPIVRCDGALVDALLPTLDVSAVRAIEAIRREVGEVTSEAAANDLPPILRSPPWWSKVARPKPIRIDDVQVAAPPDAMQWAPGERERYGAKPAFDIDNLKRRNPTIGTAVLASLSADEFATAQSAAVHGSHWYDTYWLEYLIAQRELAALPYLLRTLATSAAEVLPRLAPYAATRIAPVMATAYREKKSQRAVAKAWLLRHPRHATAGLIAQALQVPGKARTQAETALIMLAKNGHEATVLDVARGTPGVAEALSALFAFDPLDQFPAKLPKLPDFADARNLPAPELIGGRGALPSEAVAELLTMLAFSPSDEPYAGLAVVKAACEPRSLARFAWGLFSAWLTNGAPAKEAWAMQGLALFGDDAAARKLAALVREWPGEAAHARAVMGLDVLARIGSDVALMHLNGIALKLKFKALQARAAEKIEEIAESRGFTRDELEDRLAPDLGLDADGSMQLDFGPRTFVVGFDEQLRPFVKDAQGARLKDLPKPNKSDDATKAKAAGERWSLLKKDARTVAGLQIARFELAMCARRRFPCGDFLELFVQHPLVFHIVRRLVWGLFDDANTLVATLRVAEDRTFANVDDDLWELPAGEAAETLRIGLPHPLELTPDVTAAWSRVLGDYELIQPFVQLGRPTFTITEAERHAKSLDRAKGLKVPTTKLLALEQRRWRRGQPQDAGIIGWFEKPLSNGRVAHLEISPGLIVGEPTEWAEQELAGVVIYPEGSWWSAATESLAVLDPLEFSELVRDLEGLRS